MNLVLFFINMQNTIKSTGSPLQVLAPAPSVSQWHRSLSPSLPQGTSLQTGPELSGFCRFSNGQPPSSIFHPWHLRGGSIVPGCWYYQHPGIPPLSTTQLYNVNPSPGWLCPRSFHFILIPQDAASACLVMLATARFLAGPSILSSPSANTV